MLQIPNTDLLAAMARVPAETSEAGRQLKHRRTLRRGGRFVWLRRLIRRLRPRRATARGGMVVAPR